MNNKLTDKCVKGKVCVGGGDSSSHTILFFLSLFISHFDSVCVLSSTLLQMQDAAATFTDKSQKYHIRQYTAHQKSYAFCLAHGSKEIQAQDSLLTFCHVITWW